MPDSRTPLRLLSVMVKGTSEVGLPSESVGKTAVSEPQPFEGVVGNEAGAEGVLVVDGVGGVELHAVGDVGVDDFSGDALEYQIVGGVGGEVDVAVIGERGELEVEVANGFLIGEDGVVIFARSGAR